MKRRLTGAAIAALMATTAIAQTDTAAAPVPLTDSQWTENGQAAVQERLARQPIVKRAKNVILMVADGNGIATNYATRVWMGQQQGGMGDDFVQPQEAFPYLGLSKTYNTNALTPDSAPTAGALNTGVKQRFNVVNVGNDAILEDCSTVPGTELETFAELVTKMDKSVGIVTTARLTHATPAAVYAKSAARDWEEAVPEGCDTQKDIASQLLDQMQAGVVDYAMGGGRAMFAPKGTTTDEGKEGKRADGRNLIDEAKAAGAQYAWNTETANALNLDGTKPVLALMDDSHMNYEYDRTDEDEPSLADMTKMAIEYLKNDEDGYYLEIEGGRVDHANHAGNLYRTLTDGAAFADAVAMADELTDDEDTLIIVTADHSHALIFNGYCGRGSPINGLCYEVALEGEMHSDTLNLADDGKPYTVAGYLNGAGSVLVAQDPPEPEANSTPLEGAVQGAAAGEAETIAEYSGTRPEVTQEEATDPDYLQQALIPMGSETHSSEDVAIYAKGPYAHLVDGTMEQSVIFHIMKHAVEAE